MTSLFMVRNITSGYSFSKVEQAENLETPKFIFCTFFAFATAKPIAFYEVSFLKHVTVKPV